MTFEDVTTPFEKRMMLLYGADGHKIVRNKVLTRKICNNLFMGEIEKRDAPAFQQGAVCIR